MNQTGKKSLIFVSAILGLMFAFYQPAFADDAQDQGQTTTEGYHHHHHHHHHHGKRLRKAFRMGVCVGQTLAQEGIILPAPVAGQHPKLDDATKAALKAAFKTCKAAFEAAQPTNQTDLESSEAVEADDSVDANLAD